MTGITVDRYPKAKPIVTTDPAPALQLSASSLTGP